MADSTPRARERRRRYERTRQARAIAELTAWVNRYKTEQGCVDCGFNRWAEALQFDHVDRATKQRRLGWHDNRSKIHSRTKMDRFKAHVKRYCVVRCANCHAHRSLTEQHWQPHTTPDAIDELTLF